VACADYFAWLHGLDKLAIWQYAGKPVTLDNTRPQFNINRDDGGIRGYQEQPSVQIVVVVSNTQGAEWWLILFVKGPLLFVLGSFLGPRSPLFCQKKALFE
jgi:hypothetical protein